MANGADGTVKVLGWIGGFFGFLILLYTTFHLPLVRADAKETQCRQDGDNEIRQEMAKKFDEISRQNKNIEVMMARLDTNVEHIKKVID